MTVQRFAHKREEGKDAQRFGIIGASRQKWSQTTLAKLISKLAKWAQQRLRIGNVHGKPPHKLPQSLSLQLKRPLYR